MMRHLALRAQTRSGPAAAPAVRRGPRPGAQAIVLAWFSLGVLTSGAAGVGALMGLRALEARGTPMTAGVAMGAAWTPAWANVPAMKSAPKPARRPDRAWDRVEIAIERSARGHAPLGLQVTGAGELPFEVILDGVPASVRLSRGAPVGPSTWVVGRADLKGLHLILGDAAPQTFELKIAVTAPAGVATTGSIVHVHLIDGPAPTQTAVAVRSDRTRIGRDTRWDRAAAAAPPAPRHAAPARTDPAGSAAGPAAPTETAARSWPEGASALGAVPRAPRQPAWWNAPPPGGSPFQDGAQHP